MKKEEVYALANNKKILELYDDTGLDIYRDIGGAWSNQEDDERIVKVSVEEITELEILYDRECPNCQEKGTHLKEDDRIYCTRCNEWYDAAEEQTIELDSMSENLVKVTAAHLIEQGHSKEQVIKLLKKAVDAAASNPEVQSKSLKEA